MQMYVLYVYERCESQTRMAILDNFICPWIDSSLSDPPKGAIHLLSNISDKKEALISFVEDGELFPGDELHLTEERFAEFILRFA